MTLYCNQAVSGNNVEVVKLILNKIKEQFSYDSQQISQYINAKDNEGDTPLMWAAEKAGKINTVYMVITLLEFDVDVNV